MMSSFRWSHSYDLYLFRKLVTLWDSSLHFLAFSESNAWNPKSPEREKYFCFFSGRIKHTYRSVEWDGALTVLLCVCHMFANVSSQQNLRRLNGSASCKRFETGSKCVLDPKIKGSNVQTGLKKTSKLTNKNNNVSTEEESLLKEQIHW